jgi:hypothetical protein
MKLKECEERKKLRLDGLIGSATFKVGGETYLLNILFYFFVFSDYFAKIKIKQQNKLFILFAFFCNLKRKLLNFFL